MQVLDQQLVSMCERVQSDLPYSTKCEEVVHSKHLKHASTCSYYHFSFHIITFISLFLGSPKLYI